MKLLGIATMQASKASDIKITWGALDGLSAKTKAEVFKLFADGAWHLSTERMYQEPALQVVGQPVSEHD